MRHFAHSARFSSRLVAENYLYRPPYSINVYQTLAELLRGQPRVLLDAGCGPGKITLGLLDRLERSDAVDPSAEMLRIARSLPNGSSSKINWIQAPVEEAQFDPPYGLIVCAASIHWMDLDRMLARFSRVLNAGGYLSIVDGDSPVDAPWERDEVAFMTAFLEKIGAQRPDEWKTARQLLSEPRLVHPAFEPVGCRITSPLLVSQSIGDYLRGQHSRATWAEDYLGAGATAKFDAKMTALDRPIEAVRVNRCAHIRRADPP